MLKNDSITEKTKSFAIRIIKLYQHLTELLKRLVSTVNPLKEKTDCIACAVNTP